MFFEYTTTKVGTVGSSSGNIYGESSGLDGKVFSYIKSYSNGTNTLEAEKNAGLITTIKSYDKGYTALSDKVYWRDSLLVYVGKTRYDYTLVNKCTIAGFKNSYSSSGSPDWIEESCSSLSYSSTTLNPGQVSTSSDMLTYGYETLGSSSYDSGKKRSEVWEIFHPYKNYSSTSKVKFKVEWGALNSSNALSNVTHENATWKMYICGGSNAGKYVQMKKTSTAGKYDYLTEWGSSATYSYPSSSNYTYSSGYTTATGGRKVAQGMDGAGRNFIFAATAESSVSSDVRTYNYNSSSNCSSYTNYSIGASSYPIYYRPYIEVKI